MANVEKSGYMKYKDKSGNMTTMYPKTTVANVEGLDDRITEAKTINTPVAATSADGVAYVATVPGITALTAGYSFIMIPDKISSSISTTLNVNGLGAKALRVRVSGYSGTTSSPMTTNWLAPNKPVRVTYDGMWWIAEVVLPSADQLYGDIKAETVKYTNTSSGLSATQVQAAIDELAGKSGGLEMEEFKNITVSISNSSASPVSSVTLNDYDAVRIGRLVYVQAAIKATKKDTSYSGGFNIVLNGLPSPKSYSYSVGIGWQIAGTSNLRVKPVEYGDTTSGPTIVGLSVPTGTNLNHYISFNMIYLSV